MESPTKPAVPQSPLQRFRLALSRFGAAFRRLDDKLLLAPKIIYFVVSTAFYALYLFRFDFINTYLGLGDDRYGDISAIMALVSFSFMTVWGTFADMLGRHRLVLAVLCTALTGAFELNILVANVASDSARFDLAAVTLALFSFFACGIPPLADYLTLRMLSNRPGFSRDLYGKQRLWGTISYGLTTLVVGWLSDMYSIRVLFYVFPISSAACVLTLMALAPADDPKPLSAIFRRSQPSDEDGEAAANDQHKGDKPTTEQVEPTEAKNKSAADSTSTLIPDQSAEPAKKKTRSPFLQLLLNPSYMFMLVVVFMTGSARAVMTTFLSKYWKEQMHLSSRQSGLAANFGIVLEITIFYFGPQFLRIFGTYWLLIFAQLAMVVRCWAYVLLPADPSSVWLVFLVELLKGVAFGCTQLAGVKLASDAAPKELEATAQALYTAVYSQLPTVLTSFAGSRVYKSHSPKMLFQITSVVMTAGMVLFVLKYLVDGSIRIPCRRRPREDEPARTAPS